MFQILTNIIIGIPGFIVVAIIFSICKRMIIRDVLEDIEDIKKEKSEKPYQPKTTFREWWRKNYYWP